MAISRAERRAGRTARVVAIFGDALAASVLDLLELTELAWHDCYGEITPSEEMVDDILLCSKGELAQLIRVARQPYPTGVTSKWRQPKLGQPENQIRTRGSEVGHHPTVVCQCPLLGLAVPPSVRGRADEVIE